MTTPQNSRGTAKRKPPRGRPFKPGQSGNPGGRPRKNALTDAYRDLLARDAGNGQTLADMIAEAVLRKARRGDVKAAREIADRTEGKPRQQVSVEGQIDATIVDRLLAARKRRMQDGGHG